MSTVSESVLVEPPWRHRLREAAVPTLAGAAVMTASLANFLNHNQYPFLRAEIGVLASALLVAVAAMGLLYASSGPLVRLVLQVLLVYVALDINFDGLIVPIGTIGIAVVLQRHAMPFLAVAAAVVLVTVVAGLAPAESAPEESPAPAADERRAKLPVLVHLILDEHIGIEGLLIDGAEAAAMGETLKEFYVERDFRLFGGAYSEHIRTMNAIPHLLNFGEDQTWSAFNRTRSTLSSNAYFDRLGAKGYRIFVSQTDYIDYCANEFVVRCETRRAAELIRVAEAPLPVNEKAYILAGEFAKLSAALTPLMNYRNTIFPSSVLAIPPLGPLETLDRLADELRTAAPGSAYLVHELLPHTPYALNRDCQLKPRAAWREQSTGPRQERMRAYFDQMTCLNTALEAIFAAAGPNAVIVVHGDHGSRITDVEPNVESIGDFDERDLIAGYSTIFAVRAPAIDVGYDARALPAAEILRELAHSGFRSADVSLGPDFVPSVILEGENWKPLQRHPLPAEWTADAP